MPAAPSPAAKSTHSPTADSGRRSRQPLPDHVDVAVVGAGLGGLAAAAYLSRHGLKVAVLDSHYVAGGCCTQFARNNAHGAFRFDIGLHYIGDMGPEGGIPTILRKLGIALELAPLDPDGFDRLVFPDFEFAIPVGWERMRERLLQYFPRERRGIDRYMRFLREVDGMGRAFDKAKGKTTVGLGLEAVLRGRLMLRYQHATIGQFLDSCTTDQRLQAVLLGQHGDYGLPPSEASALLHAGLTNHYFKGAWYPVGGGQVIADELSASIEAHGGTVHLRKPVAKILIEGGRAVGVVTEPKRRERQGHTIRAKAVVSNADIKRTLLELLGPEVLPSPWVRKAKDFQMGGAIFMTCVGLKTEAEAIGMTNANTWQFDGYDTEAYYRTSRDTGRIETKGCYITSASLKDPTTVDHAPEGVINVEVMTLVPGQASAWGVTDDEAVHWGYKRSEPYRELKQRIEDDMVGRLDTLFPGSKDAIVFQESASPVTQTRYTRATDGTGYGLAVTPQQFMQKRPGYRGPFDKLYFCGASTRSGHGVVGALMSGHHAAYSVAKDLGRPLPPEGWT